MIQPKITLVGAGPGDVEMLTLKALKAIQSANVILYDSLANTEMLTFAQPDTILINVGKQLGMYLFSQDEINKLIVEHAIQYGHVVRLKGGDPFVFGRGYEEMEYARSYNIPCEVVSGLSSSIAVPASIGIPVTTRGVADSFWVLTGTTKDGKLAADVHLAAQSSATVIILMGMSKLPEICKLFEKAGKGKMPMAIIQNGTRANQKQVMASVSEMTYLASEQKMKNPAVIIIGEVVGLAQNDFNLTHHCNLAYQPSFMQNQSVSINQ